MDTPSPKAERPNYGLDAPGTVRNLLLFGGVGLLTWASAAVGLWSGEVFGVPLAWMGIGIGIGLTLTGLWMIWNSKVGKVRARERLLDWIPWSGGENVLDVGCGRGLMLIGAAKRLTSGKAMGIDIWQAEDLSGNKPEATSNNALIEGVADRVEVQTADARKLPFDDASFDVVLSSGALHNIYNAGERQTAVREIARVLKVGGRVLIVDVRHIRHYARTLRDAGFDGEKAAARSVQNIVWHLLTILTFGSVQIGYVIGSKAR